MAKTNDYLYPRVDITTRALKHSSEMPAPEDTTILFAPVITPKGPSQVVTPLHSISELTSTFGSLSYEKNGNMAANIYNWLDQGGTVYLYRMAGMKSNIAIEDGGDRKGQIFFESGDAQNPTTVVGEAKFYGESYNDTHVDIKFLNPADVMDIDSTEYVSNGVLTDRSVLKEIPINLRVVASDGQIVEEYFRLTLNNMIAALSISDYVKINKNSENDLLVYIISQIDTSASNSEFYQASTDTSGSQWVKLLSIDNAKDYSDEDNITDINLLPLFWGEDVTNGNKTTFVVGENAIKALGNKLETPIDMILDAGYPKEIKKAMWNFIAENSSTVERDDIVGIFDAYVLNGKLETPTAIASWEGFEKSTNVAIYDQYYTVEDTMFANQNIYVTPTYFLSRMIPYSDLTYGIQYPVAGLRRGIIYGALAVNTNPRPKEKDSLFRARINYAEKTSRELAFMSQRTYDGSTSYSYTALSFLNNSRVLQKMKKDLERMGRNYLFEFNDSTTLAQMSQVLNDYVTNWITNRTLSKGVVIVQKNPYSDEAVDVNLTIRFNGTIEVISVDITIE